VVKITILDWMANIGDRATYTGWGLFPGTGCGWGNLMGMGTVIYLSLCLSNGCIMQPMHFSNHATFPTDSFKRWRMFTRKDVAVKLVKLNLIITRFV